MAEKFDVTSRLAEGRPAVENIQTYVSACHALGYANPDLTLHASQVRDWYASEDGLDLRALDTDCVALEAAVAATEDALARQDHQLGALPAAWQGRSADLSLAFLRRHGEASAAAAAAVRTAADALVTLRDNLWHAVDGKVAAAMSAGDRAPAEWLAAAHTVTTGAGDRAAASERIDQEVKPFVDNDIRVDWLEAMRSAMAAVIEMYDAATAELTGEPDAVFEVPGELGPSWTPSPRGDEVATVPAAASPVAPPAASQSWGAPAAPPPMPAAPVSAPVSAPMPAPSPAPTPAPPVDTGSTAPAMAAPPSAPSMGGLPDIGGGLSGFGQQLADAFGSLFGSADDALSDTPGIDDPELDEDSDDESDEFDDEPEEHDEPVDPAAESEEEPAAEEPIEAPAVEPVCEPAAEPVAVEPPPPEEPAPTPVAVPPPPAEPLPPPEPMGATQTPCEIAADELPQVGE